ncbi:MAG: hypothetical protein ACRDYD_00930 [Acidimicrobiales bacterium]
MASGTSTFPLSGPMRLLVRLGHGSITVAAQDDLAEAVVRLSPADRQRADRQRDVLDRVTVEMQGSELVVSGPHQGGLGDLLGGWRRSRDRVDAVIEVPTGTPVTITSASDEIRVTGRCGDTDIATNAGRITLDTVAGDLRLRYGHADTRVATVTGSAQIAAAGGSAHLGAVGGDLECELGTGELGAEVVRGGVRSRAGRASARLGAVHGDVDVAIGSGPISIGLPAGVAAQVDVATGTGRVCSDLPVEEAPAPAARTITVRARTGAGDVRLSRAAA